jgi:hypothetical protein
MPSPAVPSPDAHPDLFQRRRRSAASHFRAVLPPKSGPFVFDIAGKKSDVSMSEHQLAPLSMGYAFVSRFKSRRN